MNVTIQGIFRGASRKDTKGNPPKERYYISIEQKSNDGLPVVEKVTSYLGLNGMKDGDRVSLECFDSLNTWQDNFGKFHARQEYIFKGNTGKGVPPVQPGK